jgi:hypothetical protein
MKLFLFGMLIVGGIGLTMSMNHMLAKNDCLVAKLHYMSTVSELPGIDQVRRCHEHGVDILGPKDGK